MEQMPAQTDAPAVRVGVFGERNMRWYLGGQLFSLAGTMLQLAVIALLILSIAGKENGAFWVGVVSAIDLLPGCLLGPLAGLLLDRFDKRKILLVTAALGVVQTSILAFLTYTNQITIWEICALAFFMGIVNAVDGPGRNVIVKDAVEHEYNVRSASKTFTSLYNLAQIAGPGIAGFLILTFGYPLTFVINGLSFLALIIALSQMRLRVREASVPPPVRASVPRLLKDGARYTLGEPGIRVSIMLVAILCMFGYFYYPILAVIARDLFQGGPLVYSYLAASAGVGSFIGALILLGFPERVRHSSLVIGGMICMALALIALAFTSWLPIGIALLGFMGLSFMVAFSSLRSSVVHLAKQEYAGIVMGYTFTFFYGSITIGSFVAGSLANAYGSSFVLILGGCALLVSGVVAAFLPGIREIDR